MVVGGIEIKSRMDILTGQWVGEEQEPRKIRVLPEEGNVLGQQKQQV